MALKHNPSPRLLTSHPGALNQSLNRRDRVLADDKEVVTGEAVLGDLEVQRRRALARTAGDVVVRAMARAEPATVVAGFTDGDTTEVGADAYRVRTSQTMASAHIWDTYQA